MKMIHIVYNEAVDTDVMDMLKTCGIKNYTKIMGIYGKGDSSGTHLGNDIWPGRNNLLYVACGEKDAAIIISHVKTLRQKMGREGVKAFVLPVEEVT